MIASSAARSFALGQEALRLVEQPDVLEGDAQARGQGRQEPDVAVAEGVLVVEVLERDDAADLAAGERAGRTATTSAGSPWIAPACPASIAAAIASRLMTRGACEFEHLLAEADQRHGLVREAHAALDRVREVEETIAAVDDADVDDLRVEDLLDLVADQVVHGLRLERAREALLDAVDDRQLGGALLRLAEEDVRLLEQAGVLEGDAHARGDRRDDLLVGLAEGVLRGVGEHDGADGLLAGHDRDAEPRRSGVLGHAIGVGPDKGAVVLLLGVSPEAQRPAGLQHLGSHALADHDRLAVHAPALVELEWERDQVRRPGRTGR